MPNDDACALSLAFDSLCSTSRASACLLALQMDNIEIMGRVVKVAKADRGERPPRSDAYVPMGGGGGRGPARGYRVSVTGLPEAYTWR